MSNLYNPILSLSAAAGIMAGLLSGRAMAVPTGANTSTSAAGPSPSGTVADYNLYYQVATAVALELDTTLGQNFDAQLASNANPGITVAMSGAGAGTASAALAVKAHAMWGIAFAMFQGKSPADATATDYATIAAAISAQYRSWLQFYTNSVS